MTLVVIAIVLTLFAARLIQLQGLESGHYRTLALTEQLKTKSLPAMRGTIYGANGQLLATTVETYTVTSDPTQIRDADKPAVAQKLAPLLGVSAAKLLNLLRHPSSRQWVLLANNVSLAHEVTLTGLDIAGIASAPVYVRSYPDGNATANLVGYTNTSPTDVIAGYSGLEYTDNKLLTGTNGSERVEIGADGQAIPLAGSEDTPAVNGESIKLTIIPSLQYAAQRACAAEVEKTKAQDCTAVVMRPGTGDILAMAQWPPANPNAPKNIAVENVFEPGSTAKVITASAALEHGGQTPMSSYEIPYEIFRGGQWIRDAEYTPNEDYTIAGIIANSSNVGMSQVVEHVPEQMQYDYLRNFGLGATTGLHLPAESPGILPPVSQWAADERYTLSYGQGVDATAVQMASVYATIANNGVRVQPRLIAGTYNAAGQYTPAKASSSTKVIEPKTAKELISILQQVPGVDAAANQNWGELAGYAIAAKTGTSSEPSSNPKKPCPTTNPLCVHGSSYIGMAPGNDPKVVVAINVQAADTPDYFGDEVAGPVFYNVMNFALQTLAIQPQPGLVAPHVRLNGR
jgi:cell division protein FtsI (penicillin-binding protein 3)